jgi:hypothetical protein
MALGQYVTKFTTNLDKLIARETLTSDLNMNQDLLGEFSGAGEIKVSRIAMDGLADYDREAGFAKGAVTTDWETYKLRYDRGREFAIDAMDDEERAAVVSANVMAEFERTKVIPEVDALRFAALAAGAGNVAKADLSTADAALKAVLEGEQALEDAGSDLSKCALYLTSAVKGLLRQSQNYRIGQGEDPSGRFKTFDDMKLVTVPGDRFYDAVDLADGRTSGQTEGGYSKHVKGAETGDVAGVGLNFVIVDPQAAAAIQRHKSLRYFSPDTYQGKEAHVWQYRLFHDLLVYENKKALIYCHKATK